MAKGGLLLRRLRARVSDRPTGFVWVRERALAASGCPASRRQVDWVRSLGITRILTLTESPLPRGWVDGLEVKHIPMRDHEPPSLDSLTEASSYIAEGAGGGRVTLVHCLAGQGRTMCAIAAHLIRSEGMDVDDALRSLRRIRPGAVESSQEGSVRRFASLVRRDEPDTRDLRAAQS